jgi:DNA-binding NtrC family response regulator
MATRTLSRPSDVEFSSQIEDLKTTLKALLREAGTSSQHVSIDPEKGIDFYENVAKFERELIELALEMTGGRQNRAARLLRMREPTLSWKIKRLNIRYGLDRWKEEPG